MLSFVENKTTFLSLIEMDLLLLPLLSLAIYRESADKNPIRIGYQQIYPDVYLRFTAEEVVNCLFYLIRQD